MAKRTAAPAPAKKRTAAPKKTNGAVRTPEPTEDDIRIRAYHRYLERGGVPGSDFDDWLEAEKDLKSNAS
jgi:hypothetical protein